MPVREDLNEIPALNQLSAYFEVISMLNIDECPVTIQAGVRYTVLQPGKNARAYGHCLRE